ncbi:MAG TPA: peptidoglycan-binding protein, partial [Candidatus Paceibacterota bacterium]
MRKFILALSLGLLLVLPVTSFAQSGGDDVITIETLIAQIKALQQQILLLQQNSGGGSGAGNIGGGGTSTSGGTIVPEMCLRLTYSLYAGQTDAVTGGEVSKLQQFLAGDASLYPEGLVTGFFGPATERAVQRLQTKHGIISSGSPDTTGYGFVGPQTRAVLQKEGVCGGGGGGGYGASPVIHGVKGPTSLAVGEEGAWAIEASNANGGYLSYSVTWGDEGYNIYPNQSAPSVIPQRQSSTFTHIYRNSGNYTPQFKVTNDRGLGAGASLSVVVGSGVTPPPVPGPLTIKTSSNLNGSVGTYFQATFEAFGWRSPIKFQVSEGRLPAGLELVPAPVYALGIPCYIDSCL